MPGAETRTDDIGKPDRPSPFAIDQAMPVDLASHRRHLETWRAAAVV